MRGCFSSLSAVTLISMKGTLNSFEFQSILEQFFRPLLKWYNEFYIWPWWPETKIKSKNTCCTKTRSQFCNRPASIQAYTELNACGLREKKAPRQYDSLCFREIRKYGLGSAKMIFFPHLFNLTLLHHIWIDTHCNSSTLCSDFLLPLTLKSHKRPSRQFGLLHHLSWSFLLENRWNKRLPVSLNAPTYHSPSDIC